MGNLRYEPFECGLAQEGGIVPPEWEAVEGKELDGGVRLGNGEYKLEWEGETPVEIGNIQCGEKVMNPGKESIQNLGAYGVG